MTELPERTTGDRRSHRLAALLTALEGVLLLGFSGFYGYEILVGATDDLTRAATSGGLILIFGIFLLFMARGWARWTDWPRTPTLLWNVLLVPVAWSLWQSDRGLLALGVAVVAGASIVAALGSRPNDPIRRGEDGDEEDGGHDTESPGLDGGGERRGPLS